MPLVPFTAGQKLTAALLNAAFDVDRVVWQAAMQTVTNSTTLVSSTSLTLPVEANALYTLDSLIIYDAPTVQDFKYSWLVPSGASVRQSQWSNALADGAVNSAVHHSAADTVAGTVGGVGAGTMMTMKPSGGLLVGLTAGSLTFQFAQSTAGAATSAVLHLGSWVRLTRVA